MEKIAFFDTKPYDRLWFDRLAGAYEITYFEGRLNASTAPLAAGHSVVCAFVNDEIDAAAIDALLAGGVRLLAMRSAGYNNVDIRHAYGRLPIVRVPAYSPHAVAEHAMALLLTLNRKTHKAYIRTRDQNFSLVRLTGIDLFGKTLGVVGTGKIGRCLLDIGRGFGMKTIAYDPFPAPNSGIDYVPLDTLLAESDVISLHCPLTPDTTHILDAGAFARMKKRPFVLNTSRGELVDSAALLDALNAGRVRGAGLDVYEEEADLFFEDRSETLMGDDLLSRLIAHPNVLLTSHQAFLTEEALENIARETIANIDEFFAGGPLKNEVCYQCPEKGESCPKKQGKRCF